MSCPTRAIHYRYREVCQVKNRKRKKKRKKKKKERKEERKLCCLDFFTRPLLCVQYRFDITSKSFIYSQVCGFSKYDRDFNSTLRSVPTFREYTSSVLRGRPETVSVTANCPKEALNYLELITKRWNKGQRVINPLSANLFFPTSSVCRVV